MAKIKCLWKYQCGFRPETSTTDKIFAAHQTFKKCFEFNIHIHVLFIECTQEFEVSEWHGWFRYNKKENKLQKLIILNSKAKVIFRGIMSWISQIASSIRQWDQAYRSNSLTLILWETTYRVIQVNTYADDIILVASNTTDLEEMVRSLKKWGHQTIRIS